MLTADEARQLLEGFDTGHVVGLRDRALIAAMVYSLARVSAIIHMKVEDYYTGGKRWWLRLAAIVGGALMGADAGIPIVCGLKIQALPMSVESP